MPRVHRSPRRDTAGPSGASNSSAESCRFVRRLERLNHQIDLRRLEARRLDLEIERYVRELSLEQSPLCDRPSSSGRSACCRPACRLWPGARSDARGGSPALRRDRSSCAASYRPCPATIRFARRTRMGALKPNASMLRAIARICSGSALRGLLESGTIDPMGW